MDILKDAKQRTARLLPFIAVLTLFSLSEWHDSKNYGSWKCLTDDEVRAEKTQWRATRTPEIALKLSEHYFSCTRNRSEAMAMRIAWLRRAAAGGDWMMNFKLAAWLDETDDMDDIAEALLLVGKLKEKSDRVQLQTLEATEKLFEEKLRKHQAMNK